MENLRWIVLITLATAIVIGCLAIAKAGCVTRCIGNKCYTECY